MSINFIQNELKNLSNEISKLNKNLSDEQKNEAKKMDEIARIKKSITKNTSITVQNSKTKQMERLNDDIMKSRAKQADINKKLGEKQKKYGLKQNELNKEYERIQKQIMQNQKKLEQQQIVNIQQYKYVQENEAEVEAEAEPEKEYDFFISHASEDKAEVAEPLARELEKLGAKVWFDKFTLKIGDSLRKSIDNGLAKSKFGIVILTSTYFKKFWTEKELNGLFSRYSGGNCKILPIWHNVSKEEVSKNSPILADILGLKTADYTIEEIAKELYKLIN